MAIVKLTIHVEERHVKRFLEICAIPCEKVTRAEVSEYQRLKVYLSACVRNAYEEGVSK